MDIGTIRTKGIDPPQNASRACVRPCRDSLFCDMETPKHHGKTNVDLCGAMNGGAVPMDGLTISPQGFRPLPVWVSSMVWPAYHLGHRERWRKKNSAHKRL
ncbi:unnamed protein product [Ectocarpus sp. 13 AM-2016]